MKSDDQHAGKLKCAAYNSGKSHLSGVWCAMEARVVIRNYIDERRTRPENRATEGQKIEDYPAIAIGKDEIKLSES